MCKVTSDECVPSSSLCTPVSCRVKDNICVKLTAVLSYSPPKLLDSCLQENNAPHRAGCHVSSDYIYVYIFNSSTSKFFLFVPQGEIKL